MPARERRRQRLQRLALRSPLREIERLAPHGCVRVGEELEQQRRGPRLLDAAHDLAQHLAAHVGVDALEREAQRRGPGAADLQRQRCLEGLAAHACGAVVERALQQRHRLGVALGVLLQVADQQGQPAAAHVVGGRQQAGLGGAQRGLLLEAGQGGEGGVAHLAAGVAEHLPEALGSPRIAELGERLARLDPGRRRPLAGELEQGAEGPLVLERGQRARAEQAGVDPAARHRLEQRAQIVDAELDLALLDPGRLGLGGALLPEGGELPELPVQVPIARPEGLGEGGARRQRDQERGAAHVGVVVPLVAAQRGLHLGLAEELALEEAHQRKAPHVGPRGPQRGEARLGGGRLLAGARVVDGLERGHGGGAHLDGVVVERADEAGHGLIVAGGLLAAGGQLRQRGDRGGAQIALLLAERELQRAQRRRALEGPEPAQRGEAHLLLGRAEQLFEGLLGARVAGPTEQRGRLDLERVVGIHRRLRGEHGDGPGVVVSGERLQRLLAAARLALPELALGEPVRVVEGERAVTDLAAGVEREETDRPVVAEQRQVWSPLVLDAREARRAGGAVLLRGRAALLRPAPPGLDDAVAPGRVELVLRAEGDAGGQPLVPAAAAAILGLERAADVGEQELVVRAGGEHPQLVRIEQQDGDRALVELLRLPREEVVLVLRVEDHHRPARRARDEPPPRRIGGERAALLRQGQPLPGGAGLAVEDHHLGAGEHGEAPALEQSERRRRGGELGPERRQLAGRVGCLVDLAVGAGDVERALVGDDRGAAGGQGEGDELALVDVEAVEGGGLALRVDGDEGQHVPLGDGRAEGAPVGDELVGARSFHGHAASLGAGAAGRARRRSARGSARSMAGREDRAGWGRTARGR